MIKNYLKIAWRNLVKNKVFSFINIAGLATGLASFILIALYVVDELSYDRYNDKAGRIYRINSYIRFGGTDLKMAVSSDAMGAALKNDYPEVEEYVRFYNSSGSKLVKKGNQFINENNVAHADSTLFSVFTLPAISGNTHTALNEPNTVVITESTAKKYFGTTDNVVGKTIETNENNSTLYKVTAVIKDIPHNSHFHFDFIFSMKNVDYRWGNYVSHNFQTYVLLRPRTDPRAFEKNFPQYITKYVLPQAKEYMQINSMEEFRKAGNRMEYTLMPLTDIHLHSDMPPELGVNGNIQYVYIFSAVAIFILFLACINFMNLSTARSVSRSKEVGIRKVLGTQKKSLIGQFLTESTLTVFLALILGILIAWFFISYFNHIADKELSIADLFKSNFLIFLILLPFVVGIVAGFYPAFFLSSFQPITVLKGKLNAGFKKNKLRSTLVIFQFFISITLIIGTIIVYQQLGYIQNKKLGFNKDQVLLINSTGTLANPDAFRNEISKLSGVRMSSFAGYLPVEGSSRSDYTFSKEAVMDSRNGFNMQAWNVDYDYVKTMGMEIIKGRNFSPDYGTDSSAVIINETAAAILGYENPVGKKVYTSDNNNPPKTISYTIIGVVRNFHFESLRQNISPLSFKLGWNKWVTAFKVSPADVPNLLKTIEGKWKADNPAMTFSYQFLDDAFDHMYRAEQRVGKVAISFAILAILIACLGLFGLATFIAEQRIKEIGVRKVLGASVYTIVVMLSKDFAKLVLISAILAFPVAWWAMHSWLQNFAYRINIGWWIFIVAGLLALIIAIITVSFQAIKAAIANPVKSLRTE
jgi:putative ABC transport system permease protein